MTVLLTHEEFYNYMRSGALPARDEFGTKSRVLSPYSATSAASAYFHGGDAWKKRNYEVIYDLAIPGFPSVGIDGLGRPAVTPALPLPMAWRSPALS